MLKFVKIDQKKFNSDTEDLALLKHTRSDASWTLGVVLGAPGMITNNMVSWIYSDTGILSGGTTTDQSGQLSFGCKNKSCNFPDLKKIHRRFSK